MAGIDINRTTAGVADLLPREVSQDIWASTIEQSSVMQLAQRINLPAGGVQIPIITGDVEAQWLNETDESPVSRATVGSKTIAGYKLSVTEPFSNEFRRDLPGLYAELARRLPLSLGKKYDQTVYGQIAAPGADFDQLNGAASVGINGDTYAGLVAADQSVATGGGSLNGWALSPQARGILLGSVDGQGRPLFINSITGESNVPRLLGSPTFFSKGVYAADADGAGTGTDARLGFTGDWSSAMWGSVQDVRVSISDQATINDGGTQLNLWQREMFAVKATIEVGFAVRDLAHFVQLTSASQA